MATLDPAVRSARSDIRIIASYIVGIVVPPATSASGSARGFKSDATDAERNIYANQADRSAEANAFEDHPRTNMLSNKADNPERK